MQQARRLFLRLAAPGNPSGEASSKDPRRKDPRRSNPSLSKWPLPCPRPKIAHHLHWPIGNLRFEAERAENSRSKDHSGKIPRRSLELRSNWLPGELLPSCPCFGDRPSSNLLPKGQLREVLLFGGPLPQGWRCAKCFRLNLLRSNPRSKDPHRSNQRGRRRPCC